MATTTVAPVSAPAGGGAAPAAPATSTPSAPVTSTPDVSTQQSPAQEPQSLEQTLGAAWEKAKEAPIEGTEVTAPAEETPGAVPEVTPEQAVEAQVTEPEKDAATEVTEPVGDETLLDDGESLGPKAFADELGKDAAAQKFFNDRPELKNKVFGALRRDQENREIRELVPDVETAKMVTGAAATFQTIDNHFLEATTPEGAQAFLGNWVKEALITDDKGQPKFDADGKYQFHPALNYTFNHIFSNKLSVLKEQAEKSGNDALAAAIDVISGATSPSPQGLDDVPDELKPHAESLKAQKAAFDKEKADADRQRQEAAKATHEQSVERSESKASESVRSQLQPLFARAGLSDFEKQAALERIGEQIDEQLGQNALYQSIYNSILQQPPSEDREKRLTAHILKFVNERLGKISATVVRDAKAGTLDRQTARQDKVTTQQTTSRTDPRGTSVTTTPAKPQTVTNAMLIKEYQDSHGGETPSMEWLMGEAMKRNSPVSK